MRLTHDAQSRVQTWKVHTAATTAGENKADWDDQHTYFVFRVDIRETCMFDDVWFIFQNKDSD